MQPNRIMPRVGPEAYKTYQVAAPLSTHWRKATCAEVDCEQHEHGWRVRVEGLPPEMLHAAKTSGRRWREEQIAEGETWLLFEAGQACFKASEHRIRVDRPELFLVKGGDFRGNPHGIPTRQHANGRDWVDDFGEHQQRVADQREKG